MIGSVFASYAVNTFKRKIDMAKLITDACSTEGFKFITESVKSKDKPPMYILEGVYAQAEVVNGNQRSYPYKLLKGEIERFDKEMI